MPCSSFKFNCLHHSKITIRKRTHTFLHPLLLHSITKNTYVRIFLLILSCVTKLSKKSRCIKYVPWKVKAKRFFHLKMEIKFEWSLQMIQNLPAWCKMIETVQILGAIKTEKWNKALSSPNMPTFFIFYIYDIKKEKTISKHRPKARALHFEDGKSENLYFSHVLLHHLQSIFNFSPLRAQSCQVLKIIIIWSLVSNSTCNWAPAFSTCM